jgi:hypothetical protein
VSDQLRETTGALGCYPARLTRSARGDIVLKNWSLMGLHA